MLSFIGSEIAKESIEIVADEQGIDDLIQYLQSIKAEKDHMHLIFTSEIDSYPIEESDSGAIVIKDVRLQYADTNAWSIIK